MIFGIVLLMVIGITGLVAVILKKNLKTAGVYQLYWTTKAGPVSFTTHEGQFMIKAENLQQARKLGAAKLKEKYQEKSWFSDIRFTVRCGETDLFDQEDWFFLAEGTDES